jgi:N6-adenosine-specific RNA methylase IME4
MNAALPQVSDGFACILADPPWRFKVWTETSPKGNGVTPYQTMATEDICALPVASCAADDCALFLWGVWSMLPDALLVIRAWGFSYKSCAFVWTKADLSQLDLFKDSDEGQLGLGYWTRQGTEFCLLATRGAPRRLNASIRQAVIERRREHSRKPACIHERIERLVAGPRLELFARQTRPGWTAWGDEVTKFGPLTEVA